MNPKTRMLLLRAHRWLGLPFAVLLLLQAMSGVVMVFRAELNRAIHREAVVRTAVSGEAADASVSVQAMLDRVRALHPELRTSRIEYAPQAGDALLFRLERPKGGIERYIAVDPATGVITRDAPLSRWPVQWLFELHEELWLGPTGKVVIGMNAVALMLIALSGPFLWWPGRRALRRGFTVSLTNGRLRSLRDLHRVGGIAVAAILLVSAVTGFVAAWKNVVQPAVAVILPMSDKPRAKVALRSGTAVRPVDELIATARAANDDAPVRNVRFPTGDGREVTIFLADLITGRPRASNQLSFNGYTGEVVGTYVAAKLPAGNVVIDWMLPIHTGEWLGFGGRLLMLFSGLVLCLLAVTGPWQWVVRRKLLSAAAKRNTQ